VGASRLASPSLTDLRSEVLTAANIKMTVFRVVAPCSLVEDYRIHGAPIQKTAILI
jgi:hypothetical protein